MQNTFNVVFKLLLQNQKYLHADFVLKDQAEVHKEYWKLHEFYLLGSHHVNLEPLRETQYIRIKNSSLWIIDPQAYFINNFAAVCRDALGSSFLDQHCFGTKAIKPFLILKPD